MSSRSTYTKPGNLQRLYRRHSSEPDRDLSHPAHNPELKRLDNKKADQADPQADCSAYLTTSEAANYLRMSKQFLEITRHRGGGPPYIKLARAVRYYRPSLDQWMLERQRTHTGEGD